MAAVQHRQGAYAPESSRAAAAASHASGSVSRKNTKGSSGKYDDAKMIGQWRIGRTIGKGSSGRVKIAKHSITGKYAAIKIVPKGMIISSRMSVSEAGARADKVLLGIEREIVIMKLIDHPNVLSLFDVWETSTELYACVTNTTDDRYLIMEYVPGGELFDYLVKRGRLPVSEALHYFQQIIHAVDYCHRFNICHRDLKPENLLLDKDKNIKVADFGMAAWEAGERMLETSCGSPHYASPEIVAGKAYHGSSSDIWSCGIILFALLTGRLPFDDDNIRSLLQKVKIGTFEMPDEIKDPARDLLFKMLEKDPERRIQMPDILTHPFFTSRAPRPIPGRALVSPPSLNEVERPVNSPEEIDEDIMGNLKTLWSGASDDEIIAALMSKEKTWEKAIYHLLVKYRNKHLENYNMDEEDDADAQARREARKAAHHASPPKRKGTIQGRAPLGENTTLQERGVPVSRPAAPTPKKAAGSAVPTSPASRPASKLVAGPRSPGGPRPPISNRGSSYTSTSDTPALPTPPAIVLQEATPTKDMPVSISRPTSAIGSPAELPPLNVPQVQDERLQQFFNQVATQLNTMNVRSSVISNSSGSSAILGSDYQAYLAFVGGGSAIAPSPNAAPIPEAEEEEDATQFADADDDMSDVASIHSAVSATVVASPVIGLGIGAPPMQNRLYPAPPPNQQRWSYQGPSSPRPPSPAAFPSESPQLPSPSALSWAPHQPSPDGMQAQRVAPRPPRLASRPAPPRPGIARNAPAPLQLAESSLQRDGSFVIIEEAANVASDPMAASWSSKHSAFSVAKGNAQDAFGMLKKKRKPASSPMGGEMPVPFSPNLSGSSKSNSPTSPMTPGSSNGPSPKRSWFNNLFSFKPTPMTIQSNLNISETREQVKKLLFQLNVKVQVVEIDAIRGLKCRYDDVKDTTGATITKGVRFRAEFARGAPMSNGLGYHTLVSLTQEKGAQSTFNNIVGSLKSSFGESKPAPGGGPTRGGSILRRPSVQTTHSYSHRVSASPNPNAHLAAPPMRYTASAPNSPVMPTPPSPRFTPTPSVRV